MPEELKMPSKEDIRRMVIIRRIKEEIDAIESYSEAIFDLTDPDDIALMKEIRDDEQVHLGQLYNLLYK